MWGHCRRRHFKSGYSNRADYEARFFGAETFGTISGERAGISQRDKVKGEIAALMSGQQIAEKD